MIVNICGIPHDVVECDDNFDVDCHMGYDDLCNNEQFVQAMGNAICQGFDIKEVNRE